MTVVLKLAAILALLAVGFAAVWYALSWREHNPPCPFEKGTTGYSLICVAHEVAR
jgi:hypothetical protein